jgi:hypothetical protein
MGTHVLLPLAVNSKPERKINSLPPLGLDLATFAHQWTALTAQPSPIPFILLILFSIYHLPHFSTYFLRRRGLPAPFNLIAPFTCKNPVKIAILVDFSAKRYQKSREPEKKV